MSGDAACPLALGPLGKAGIPQSRQLDRVQGAMKEKDRRKCLLGPELSRKLPCRSSELRRVYRQQHRRRVAGEGCGGARRERGHESKHEHKLQQAQRHVPWPGREACISEASG